MTTIIHKAPVATRATIGYIGSKQTMEKGKLEATKSKKTSKIIHETTVARYGSKQTMEKGKLEAEKSNGEEEYDIGSKRASKIIYEIPVARHGSKQREEDEVSKPIRKHPVAVAPSKENIGSKRADGE